MSTIANLFNRIYNTLSIGRVKLGGTISTLGPDDAYPTHISNLGLGGHHSYENVEDLANIPTARLQVGMTATVPQYIDNANNVIKRTKYVLEKALPFGVDKLSDVPNFDISEYWKVESIADDYAGAFQTQYAPNIDSLTNTPDVAGGQPPFPGKAGGGVKLTQAQYNVTAYWVDTYDATKNHVWQRQRFADSPNANWGIPVKVNGESYEQGDYVNNLFQRAATIPDTPAQFVNGKPNNLPAGWFDIPPAGSQALWLTKAQKDTYGQIKSPWTTPIEIVFNPLLVRYNEVATPNPNSLDYAELESKGWVAVFDPLAHKYLATRQEVSAGIYTQWTVIKIADESGEYIDYIYKAFDLSLVNDILQNPDTYRPVGTQPVTWSDTPLVVSTTQQLFLSSARKFINGELINDWSDPIPFSGIDTILALVTSSGGDEFKWDKNVTPNVVAPLQLQLTATLYRGVTEVIPDLIQWTKIYNNGNLDATNLGVLATITILPADVVGKAIFRASQTFQGTTYDYEYSILDISDGIDAKSLVLTGNSQIITLKNDGSRLPTSITLSAYSSNLSDEPSFRWYKKPFGGVESQIMVNGNPYLSNQLSVNYADFAATIENTYRVESDDGLDDDFTVYQVQEANGGAPAILMILSNESHNVVQDEGTGITNFVGAFTRVKILEGATDVTAQWVIKKVDSAGITSTTTFVAGTTNVAMDTTAGLGTYPIQITAMGAVNAAYVTITATKTGTTLTKQFSVSKIVDPVGSIILDIDSSSAGFAFSPNNQTNKILSATLYIDGTPIVLTTGFEWKFDNVVQSPVSNQITVTPNNVEFNLTVRARVQYKGIYYGRVINITDVKDAKGIGILYTVRSTDGPAEGIGNPLSDNDKPAASVLYNAVLTTPGHGNGFVYWTSDSTNAVHMSIRKSDDVAWGAPIRIRGEHGDQGPVGNFIKNIFKWAATKPATPTGNPIPATWSDAPPPLVTNQALWMSLAEVSSITNTLVGVWSTPTQVSGTVGTSGEAGVAGKDGRSIQVFVQTSTPTGTLFPGDIWIVN